LIDIPMNFQKQIINENKIKIFKKPKKSTSINNNIKSDIYKIKNDSAIQQWQTINLTPLTYTWANPQDALHYQRLASRSFPAAAAFAREHGIINK
jgi:hypothetical protein